MWLLMSRLVDTHFLIAHWGFPSFRLGHWHDWLYWSIILIGDFDTMIFFVLLYAWVIIAYWGFWCGNFLCLIIISICDVDILMILIDSLDCLSILILLLPWLSCSFWHVCSHYCISCRLSDWLLCLYIILIVFEHDACISIHLIVIACMCTWAIYHVLCLVVCRMTALLCMLLVCVGSTSIPLSPTLWVSIISFISVFTFASVRPCVCLFLWPS